MLQIITLLLYLFNASLIACPVCHTVIGEQVRAGIFNSDFGYYLLCTLLPFFIFGIISYIVYYGFNRFKE